MLTHIKLENFQGIAEQQTLRLAPITLLFGPNSSGKSSIIRALRFAQQSFTDNLHERENYLLAKGSSIDLGNFSNFVHRHDLEKVVTVGVGLPFSGNFLIECTAVDFSFGSNLDLVKIQVNGMLTTGVQEDDPKSNFELIFQPATDESASESFEDEDSKRWSLTPASHDAFIAMVKVALRNRSTIRDELSVFHIRAPRRHADFRQLITRRPPGMLQEQLTSKLLSLLDDVQYNDVDWRIKTFTPIIAKLPYDKVVADFESHAGSENEAEIENFQILNIFRRTFQDVADRIFAAFTRVQLSVSPERMSYIGPLRSVPDRLNFVSTGASRHTSDGASVVNNLANDEQRRQKISDWLLQATDGQFALDFLQFQAKTGSEIFGDAGALVLVDVKNASRVAFADAGVGFSQILPILEHILNQDHVKKNTHFGFDLGAVLMVEQPELHLHPRMQGELLSLMVSQTTSEDSNLQIIAETHSESFVLKLQQHIRKGDISCDDVSIIFVDKDKESGVTKAFELELSPKGDFIDDWPLSFSQLRFEQAQF